MQPRVIGDPGAFALRHVRALAAGARWWAAAALAAALVALSGALLAWAAAPSLVFLVWAGVAVTFGCVGVSARTKAIAAHTQAQRWKHGWEAERRTLDGLLAAGVELVVNGAELHAGGDADHVVVYRRNPVLAVLAVVETKAGGGMVTYEDGKLLSGSRRRPIPGDPIAQASRQAQALSRLSGRSACAVVCIPDMTRGPFRVGDVTVTNAKQLAVVLHRELPATQLDERDVRALLESVHVKP